jgi:hypothetical protein
MRTPTLYQGYETRIISYRGTFNPPLQGHKDTLCHGFFRGHRGDELPPAVAMKFALDEKAVGWKYDLVSPDEKPTVLIAEERISLFSSSSIHGGWL